MSIDQNSADDGKNIGKLFSVNNSQVKTQSSITCAFCWFVLTIYPHLTDMTENDSATFKLHLERSHGLAQEIQA